MATILHVYKFIAKSFRVYKVPAALFFLITSKPFFLSLLYTKFAPGSSSCSSASSSRRRSPRCGRRRMGSSRCGGRSHSRTAGTSSRCGGDRRGHHFGCFFHSHFGQKLGTEVPSLKKIRTRHPPTRERERKRETL